jgi:hypothetical protein
MAFGIGPFRNIAGVNWKTSGGIARPHYVMLTLTVSKKNGSVMTNDWIDQSVELEELVPCASKDDMPFIESGAASFTRPVAEASFNVRFVEDLFYLSYYPGMDGPAFMGDGQGWYMEPVQGGPVSFNRDLMPVTGPVSGVGVDVGITYPFGNANFKQASGAPLPFPSPFVIGGEPFLDGTDVSCFMWLTTLGGAYCYNPFINPQIGWLIHQVVGTQKALETPLASLPIDASYAGRPMTLIGMRTNTDVDGYYDLPVSPYCELLFEVPPPGP